MNSVNCNNSFIKELKSSLNKSEKDANSSGKMYVRFDPKEEKIWSSKEKSQDQNELITLIDHIAKQNPKKDEFEILKKNLVRLESMVLAEYSKESKIYLKYLEFSKELQGSLKSKTSSLEELQDGHIYCHFMNTSKLTEKKLGISSISTYEEQCLILYTTDAYKLINATFRNQEKVFLENVEDLQKQSNGMKKLFNKKKKSEAIEIVKKECQVAIEGIHTGFVKLPSFSGDVYRGDMLSKEELKQMETGFFFDKAVFSCSKQMGISLNFAIRKPRNSLELYPAFITVRNSKNGRCTAAFSASPNEDEVAFPPNQKFRVLPITEEEKSNTFGQRAKVKIITLEEMN